MEDIWFYSFESKYWIEVRLRCRVRVRVKDWVRVWFEVIVQGRCLVDDSRAECKVGSTATSMKHQVSSNTNDAHIIYTSCESLIPIVTVEIHTLHRLVVILNIVQKHDSREVPKPATAIHDPNPNDTT